MKRSLLLFLPFLTAVQLGAANLPSPEPYRMSGKEERPVPRLSIQDFSVKGKKLTVPSFVAGNKTVILYRNGNHWDAQSACRITLQINGENIARFTWWGDSGKGQFGFPFKDIPNDPATVVADEKKGLITIQKPYLDAEGKRQFFILTLQALPQAKVELKWNIANLWYILSDFTGKELIWENKKFIPLAGMLPNNKDQDSFFVKGNFSFNTANPTQGFRLEFPPNSKGRFTLSRQIVPQWKINQLNTICMFGAQPRQMIIDLGECAMENEATPPPVGGIDFWKEDRLHVPAPATRNILPNPSFEQGFRFWSWNDGGSAYTHEKQRYEIVPEGLFGKHALAIHTTQPRVPAMRSFPMALENGKTYTLSFYAKADQPTTLQLALASVTNAGQFKGRYGTVFGNSEKPESKFKLTTEWKRYTQTFTADSAGLRLLLSGGGKRILIDGMQLEQAPQASEYVSAPIEGNFVSASPDNDLVKGKPFETGFLFNGKSGTEGKVKVSVFNAYHEKLFSKTLSVRIGTDGEQRIAFPLDASDIQEGVFVVRADYDVKGTSPYTNYYRFSVMTPLKNEHATKDIFGSLHAAAQYSRGEEIARKYRDWGFGSTSWGYASQGCMKSELEKKYGISNYLHVLAEKEKKYGPQIRKITSVTPELEKEVEETAFREASKYDKDQAFSWALYNEEEASPLPGSGKFDEYFKLQHAFARGVKRANPKAIISPTHGTSGYGKLRGYDAYEGYLSAAKKHGFKYDAIAIHPYGAVDGNSLGSQDLDEALVMLTSQMKRFGYGKETPIYLSEMFMYPYVRIPQWGALLNGDDWRVNGTVTYSLGNREFIQAASAARVWIIALKYWPQVRMTNLWVSAPFLDMHLSPILMAKAANTLGHLMPDVTFHSEIKPSANIRGYLFARKGKTPIAALWCIDSDVENGLKRGPVIDVRFGQDVSFTDLMGAKRTAKPDKAGITRIPLTPAPIFIEAGNLEKLADALKQITSNDVAATLDLSVEPTLDGSLRAKLRNKTISPKAGTLDLNGKIVSYNLPSLKTEEFAVTEKQKIKTNHLYHSNLNLKVQPSGADPLYKYWNMDYLYVPYVTGKPDWSKIPGIPMNNYHPAQPGIKKGDFEACYKLAWDKQNFYVRVEVSDDEYKTFPEHWTKAGAERMLWGNDGCLEVYFDCGANGRSSGKPGYDDDDYRYDFAQRDGKGVVYRFKEVFHQLADGVNMASKKEASENVKCHFERTPGGYTYTITFGQRYLLPIIFRKGFPFGFALYLHDKDSGKKDKALTSGMLPNQHCQHIPSTWPIAILTE